MARISRTNDLAAPTTLAALQLLRRELWSSPSFLTWEWNSEHRHEHSGFVRVNLEIFPQRVIYSKTLLCSMLDQKTKHVRDQTEGVNKFLLNVLKASFHTFKCHIPTSWSFPVGVCVRVCVWFGGRVDISRQGNGDIRCPNWGQICLEGLRRCGLISHWPQSQRR